MKNLIVLSLLICAGCTFSTMTYPLAMFIAPVASSTNSASTPGYSDIIDGKEPVLKSLTIGVLRNPSRDNWQSSVDGEVVDTRVDENALLAQYLQDSELFANVVLIDRPDAPGVDYVISCSIDCIYSIELNEWVYAINWMTIGVGFLLGFPHEESSAFYVAQATVMDTRGGGQAVVSGTLAENYKAWRYDNIYWRPDFYGYSAQEPLFERILYDFLTRSGCLQQ